MGNLDIRTDLALEEQERISKAESKLHGVRVKEVYREAEDIRITTVYVESRNAARAMGKAMGTYVTIEAPALSEPDEGCHREISECLAEVLTEMLPQGKGDLAVLIVGLGNRDVTADALGPRVVDNLRITRHVLREYGPIAYDCTHMNQVSSIEPGVMAKTGMETSEILRGVAEETHPDVMIAVDALAARSTRRLTRTIQITDTGIQPGSGVGNHRSALTCETLGVPVLAIGVPTVVDAATIVGDALERWIGEDRDFVGRLGLAELNNMYMTGKDIDALVKIVSYTISEGINIAMEKNAVPREASRD